ncbi:MAG TPA: FtsX-like permease family protein [Candidatus Limnocylindrales bacterium]|jgi:putative ABC transport system permease protein|nr:FtsX-like permease family protein [Candidatus Limnocylindrales bacterium]
MSSVLTLKLRRDLRATWSRFALMVIAIAVSLTVFGGVFYAWSVMGRETAGAYQGTSPASATILLAQAIDAEQMADVVAAARTRPGIIEATGRTQFIGAVQVNGQPRDTPLQVFVAAPDDPLAMARFYPEQSSWPAKPDEILVGRDSLALLGVKVGDELAVETATGGTLRLRVADTVYDPSLSPSPQEQTGRAYLSTAALAAVGEEVQLDQLKIQVADPGGTAASRDRDAIATVAAETAQWLQRDFGLAVREVQVPPPYAHPHQWQADALLGAMLAGGIAAVLLAAILVANMLNGLFTQQIPQIGIMKSIGARSRDIGRLYLAMTLVVAAVATVIAIGPAILIGRALLANVFAFLGIRAASLDAPWWAYAVIVLAGAGLPPLMALGPLIRTSRTTVRAAIDHRGLGSNPSGATGVLARLSRLSRLDRGVLMALRNTVRRPARFALSVGLLASAGTVFVAGVSLGAGVGAIEEEQTQQTRWDVDVQLTGAVSADALATLLRQVPDVERVDGLYVLPTGVASTGKVPVTRTYPDQGHGRVSVIAIPAGTTTFTPPKVLEGRWLEPGETGAVVLNQVARKNTVPDVRPGDDVQLLIGGTPTTWRVAGIVEERGGGSAVYTTAAGLAGAMSQPGWVNQLRIVTIGHDERTRTAAAKAVDDALTGAGLTVASAASVSRREEISAGHLGPVITIVLAIAIAMGVIGTIGLASTMSTNVLDRTREFGVMHAIGARPERVRRIVSAEGVFLAIASIVVAVVPTLLLTGLLGAGLGDLFFSAPLPYRISLAAVGIWVVIAVLGAVLATEAAATRASRITVREALDYV